MGPAHERSRGLGAATHGAAAPRARERLATSAGISIRQLERSFRHHLGRGVHEHYLALRIARARQLLRETTRTILEIALASGFASASQFSRSFRRIEGLAPRDVRAAG